MKAKVDEFLARLSSYFGGEPNWLLEQVPGGTHFDFVDGIVTDKDKVPVLLRCASTSKWTRIH